MMTNFSQKIGFKYFSASKYMLNNQLQSWMPVLRQAGASEIIFQSRFDRAIPEDVFRAADDSDLGTTVHFMSELPLARKFNEVSLILDAYAKWGVKKVIFGEKVNSKKAWPIAGWHYENLIDHFLDRFIPLANYATRVGLSPVLSPLHSGGDYWDTAFAELVLAGLRRRRLDDVIEMLILASYGYTHNKSIQWGRGGPQRWPLSKPYFTPEGQEDQLGFHNFEWIQTLGERAIGMKLPVIILDAGHPGTQYSQPDPESTIDDIREIIEYCRLSKLENNEQGEEMPLFDDSIILCSFSLDTLADTFGSDFSSENLLKLFIEPQEVEQKDVLDRDSDKIIPHYLLLPSHVSGVSDVVLNKVRPLIKKFHPTVGFSLLEALHARKVSVFPDPILFGEEQIDELRSAGCKVEILPETGIDIATILQ